VWLLLPDRQINQQPGRDVKVVHYPQRSGIHLRRPVVPHEVTQPRRANPQPYQDPPLQFSGGQFLRISPQAPRHHRAEQRTKIEPGKCRVLWHRMGFHQTFVPHLPERKAEVCRLHQQQPDDEMFADMVIANDCRAGNGQQCAQCIADTDFAATDQVINQRHVERGHHGEQQELRHRQVQIGLKADQIHDAKLHRADRHVHQQGFNRVPFPAQKRQEHQRSQAQTDQHGKNTVNLTGEIDANQAERKGPQKGGNNK